MAGEKIVIMTVENNDFFRRTFCEILKMYLPTITIIEKGEGDPEGVLDLVRKNRPLVIFMDIRLPGANGLELTKIIRREFSDQVVWIYTSYDLPEYREMAEKIGVNRFLLKDALSGAEIAAFIRAEATRKKERKTGREKKSR